MPTPVNGSSGYWSSANVTVWDAITTYVAAGREIAGQSGKNLTSLTDSAAYRYILANGPVTLRTEITRLATVLAQLGADFLEQMKMAQVILLAANGVVFIVSILYFRLLLYNVSLERLNLFQVFLAVPKNVVFKLASKSVKLGEEDDDGSDDDDDWAHRVEQMAKQQAKTEERQARESQAAAAGAAGGGNHRVSATGNGASQADAGFDHSVAITTDGDAHFGDTSMATAGGGPRGSVLRGGLKRGADKSMGGKGGIMWNSAEVPESAGMEEPTHTDDLGGPAEGKHVTSFSAGKHGSGKHGIPPMTSNLAIVPFSSGGHRAGGGGGPPVYAGRLGPVRAKLAAAAWACKKAREQPPRIRGVPCVEMHAVH